MRSRKRLKVLITAGPTAEPIDPVRFISNRSTGKMGLSILEEVRRRGHRARLVMGSADMTARLMYAAVKKNFKWCDCLIMAAAVADYKMATPMRRKMKGRGNLRLQLKPNIDILKRIAANKDGKFLVGFALESGSLCRNATAKLRAKKLDLVVANKIGRGSLPFGESRTDYLIIDKAGETTTLKGATKKQLAKVLLNTIERRRGGQVG